MVVLDVLPWLFLVLFCAIFPVVCRRRCYTVATLLLGEVWGFGSYGLLIRSGFHAHCSGGCCNCHARLVNVCADVGKLFEFFGSFGYE
jgi:hypothetical protein